MLILVTFSVAGLKIGDYVSARWRAAQDRRIDG